jgi:hypothetical protein
MIYAHGADADTVVGLSVEDQIMVSQDAAKTFEARDEAPAQEVVAFSASNAGRHTRGAPRPRGRGTRHTAA